MKSTSSTQHTKKWCEFYWDHGHQTDKCHALRLEVAELLKQGHLKDLLTERGRVTRDKGLNGVRDDMPPAPPRHDKVINVISGGSEVSEVSYAAAKRNSRRMARTEIHKTGAHNPEALQIIKFRSDESNYANDPHDDALVISLSIVNCLTKRILVDNGSSTNVIFLNAYREMGLKEADITRRCVSLVGFSGESKTTIEETILPIYAEGVNLYTKFMILDSLSMYNVILGCP